jgi:hypothetical protein
MPNESDVSCRTNPQLLLSGLWDPRRLEALQFDGYKLKLRLQKWFDFDGVTCELEASCLSLSLYSCQQPKMSQ